MIKKVTKNAVGLRGIIEIPADKSISHRAVMLSALAKGKSTIKNFSSGQDPNSTLNIFTHLGVEYKFLDKNNIEVISDGILKPPTNELDCGNSGTTMRLISGILAGQNFDSILIGDESLSKRPMRRIIEPISLMGGCIEAENYRAPLKIRGHELNAIDYVSPLASAQVKSCILLAGLNAVGTTTVSEPYLSRNHTELMLKYMGADVETNGLKTSIRKSKIKGSELYICGDISSAAYFIAAALIVPNSKIILKNVGLNPTRTGIIDVVKMMGGNIQIIDTKVLSGELSGDIAIQFSELKSCEISGEIIPRLIDEIPIIAVLATQASGKTVIKDAQDLRNKESDRIKSTVTELRKLGANIEETPDGMIIHGGTPLIGGDEVQCYNDHRLAMSLYVAGLVCKNEIAINGFEWAGISFPEFDELFSYITC